MNDLEKHAALFPRLPEKPKLGFLGNINFDGPGGCWEWLGSLNENGYGLFNGQLFSRLAHRLSYLWGVGEFDIHLTVDHLCKNRKCVNFRHFEIVTREVNALRSGCPPAENSRQTRCYKGHELVGENLISYDLEKRNRRNCRICHNERDKKCRRRIKVAKGLPEHDQRWEKLTGWAATNAAKTHCTNGHELAGENLDKHTFEVYGRRTCRLCANESHRKMRLNKRLDAGLGAYDRAAHTAARNKEAAALRTHCNSGHELIEANLVAYNLRKGHKVCKICVNLKKKERRKKAPEVKSV